MRACLGARDKSGGGGEAMTLGFLKAAEPEEDPDGDVREPEL